MEREKVLLVTLQGYFNYGNRLQNYAMQELLKERGYEVHTLMAEDHLQTYADKKWKFYIKHVLTSLGVRHFVVSYSDVLRRRRLFGFTKDYIEHLEFMPNESVWTHDWNDYKCAVTGSDQVWHNWSTIDRELEFYYLGFIEEQKRISFAPSFGFKEFPENDIEQHRQGLLGIPALSCREKEGCDLIRDLTGREAEWLLDPTLVLRRDRWEQFERRPSFAAEDGKYIFVYFLGIITEEYQREIDRLSAEYGVPVINASNMLCPEHYSITPNEFVWLIHHAAFVCTDSFHGTVFSLQFEKPASVFQRVQEGATHMFGRIGDLVEALGMQKILYGTENAGGRDTDYHLSAEARTYLEAERVKARRFLERSIRRTGQTEEREEKTIASVGARCCGCTACGSICPQQCISMTPNGEGFLYPVIDRNRCVECGRCVSACPVLGRKSTGDAFYETRPRTCAAVQKDREILKASSSGGVFTALAEETLRSGGVVFGAAFSEDFKTVSQIAVEDIADLDRLKGSKYLQSDPADSFRKCREYLGQGRQVLFTGVPCQLAGLKRYLGGDDEHLLCAEVICHGTPSPAVWQKYLSCIEAGQGKTKSVSFRDKSVSWDSFGMKIGSETGRVFSQIHQADPYMSVFLRNFALRESCYDCPAKGDNTCADLTLGDFWGLREAYPEYYDDQGVSVVVLHTDKGAKALEAVRETLDLHETDPEKSLADNWIIYRSVSRPKERDTFYADLQKKSWKQITDRYLGHVSLKDKALNLLRRIRRAVLARLR